MATPEAPPAASSPRPADVEKPVNNLSEEKKEHSAPTAEARHPEPNGVGDSPPSEDNASLPPTTHPPPSSSRPDAPDMEAEHLMHDTSQLPGDQGVVKAEGDSPAEAKSQLPDSQDYTEEPKEPASRRSSDPHAAPTSNNATPSGRKQTNGTIGSIYSGNKMRHLKKDDGVPLWRKDIQFQFLSLVFDDDTPVFTRISDGQTGLPFADVYLDAMAKSTKTSKVLKEKLRHDRASSINMAKVCLLVNFGRMNTTLNFFPEMRAQLRTYHPIPALQAHTDDTSAYKQLQDAPRLKSILKGASEDTNQPSTLDKIKQLPVPRTNPVNLIFVLAQYAPKISELHFFPPRDFFDLVLGATLSSQSRARAFLWLMWYYLESDFSEQAALDNPFGPGLVGEGTGGLPLKVPTLETLTEEEAVAENVDSPDEVQYGEEKQQERKRILVEDDVLLRHHKRQKKGTQDPASDDQVSEDMVGGRQGSGGPGERPSLDGRRGSEDHVAPASGRAAWEQTSKRPVPDEEDEQIPIQARRPRAKRAKRDSSRKRTSSGQPQQRIVLKTKMDQTPDTASPAPPGAAHPILNQFDTGSPGPSLGSSSRRPRPLTQHQLALEQNRKQRVDYLLAQYRLDSLKDMRSKRQNEVPFERAGRLLRSLPDGYDTDDENSWGKGGVCPNPAVEDDYGETANFYLSALRRTARRLQRWDWDAIAAGETENWVNEVGRGHKVEAWTGVEEPTTVAPQAAPATSKPKGRGGRKKAAASTGAEGEKPTKGRRGGRAGGRKRGSGEGRKSRASGRASKAGAAKTAIKHEPEAHEHSPAPGSRPHSPAIAAEDAGDHAAYENQYDDEIDKEHPEELDGDEQNPPPPSDHSPRGSPLPEEVASSPAFRQPPIDRNGDEGEDEASSVYYGPAPPPGEQDNAYDSDNGTDEEMASSVVGGNGYAADEMSMDLDTTAGGREDESVAV